MENRKYNYKARTKEILEEAKLLRASWLFLPSLLKFYLRSVRRVISKLDDFSNLLSYISLWEKILLIFIRLICVLTLVKFRGLPEHKFRNIYFIPLDIQFSARFRLCLLKQIVQFFFQSKVSNAYIAYSFVLLMKTGLYWRRGVLFRKLGLLWPTLYQCWNSPLIVLKSN